MREAAVVEAVRSPLGRRNGDLAGVHPVDLSAGVLVELIKRAGVGPAAVDDIIWGCVMQTGEQPMNVARGMGGSLRASPRPSPGRRSTVSAGRCSKRFASPRRPSCRARGTWL